MTQSVLILGGNGRFGRAAAQAFTTAGWQVRRFDRARNRLEDTVKGMDVVVNAWNPPDYSTWAQEMLPLHQRVITALEGHDCTVIVPANLYVFGEQTPAPWSETTPHNAKNPLGRLRIKIESAYRASGLRTILLRGGDFLDTQPSASWFDLVISKKLPKGRLTYPGRADVPHAWAYLPDIARAAVLLAQRRADLPRYADIPFPGYTLSGTELAAAFSEALGREITFQHMSWVPMTLLAPVMPKLRGLREMRYLWNTPHWLDSQTFESLLPDFRPTPLPEALRSTVAHLEHVPAPEPVTA